MAKILGNGKNEYTKQIMGDLLNSSADGADISNDEPIVRGKARNLALSDNDDGDEEILETEDDETEEEEEELTPAEIKYGKEQVQKIVQTRVGTLQAKIDKLAGFKQAFENLAEITGMSVDKLLAKINTMPIAEQASILGMTPEQVLASKSARTELSKAEKESKALKQKLAEYELKGNAKYKDYDLYKDEIDTILEENPRLTLSQAYILAKGELGTEAAIRDAEQRLVAKQVKAKQKQIVGKTAAGSTGGPKIDAGIVAAAKKVGMDPLEYAKYQNIDNLDAYNEYKKSKKK